MSAAIHVRYVGPTDHRGSRWIATADVADATTGRDARVVVPYSYELPAGLENARTAVAALLERAEWGPAADEWIGGHLPDGSYAFVVAR